MSEKQPKLKFEEEKERTATRSPPKKSTLIPFTPRLSSHLISRLRTIGLSIQFTGL